jgi:predicted transposase/invertase (TIGR01784 family)
MFKPLSLVDLGQIEDDELAKNGTADLLEMLLKQSRARTFLKWIARHPEEMQKLLDRPYKRGAIVYILGVEKKHSADESIQTMVNIVPGIKEDIKTAAQQLEQRGMQQGMQQERLHIANNMLSKGFAANLIQELAGISAEELRQLVEDHADNS